MNLAIESTRVWSRSAPSMNICRSYKFRAAAVPRLRVSYSTDLSEKRGKRKQKTENEKRWRWRIQRSKVATTPSLPTDDWCTCRNPAGPLACGSGVLSESMHQWPSSSPSSDAMILPQSEIKYYSTLLYSGSQTWINWVDDPSKYASAPHQPFPPPKHLHIDNRYRHQTVIEGKKMSDLTVQFVVDFAFKWPQKTVAEMIWSVRLSAGGLIESLIPMNRRLIN